MLSPQRYSCRWCWMPSRRASRRRLALVGALALPVAAGMWVTDALSSPSGTPVRVIVPEASTVREVADSLANGGIVEWPTTFRVYTRITGNDRRFKPGTYLFKRGTPWREIVSALTGGHGLVRSVTIPEGFDLSQIAAAVGGALGVPSESVLVAARDTSLLRRVGATTPTLEGYLFPDTYAFPEGTTARRAVSEMVRRFEREWQPEADKRLLVLGVTRHELVTLASIIEEEAKLARERPIIAGVYYNRLRAGMALQADPTVQYARGVHTERLMNRDLGVKSPYNTYTNPGLPPGPISSPGAASLKAALNPETVPYLYFVAFPDGHHVFNVSLEQHQRAVRAARPDSDSAPSAAKVSKAATTAGRRPTQTPRATSTRRPASKRR